MASTLGQYEPRHSSNMQLEPVLVSTRRSHAAKDPDFRASVSPQEQGLNTHLRTLRLPMDRNKDVKMDKVLFCTAEELLKYLTGHSGEKEFPLQRASQNQEQTPCGKDMD